MRSHAIANGVFVAAANRTGIEGTVRILGRVVRGRSERQRAGPGIARQRRDAAGRVRPGPDRRRPHALAVPARPPHRRLRRFDKTISGLSRLAHRPLPTCRSRIRTCRPPRPPRSAIACRPSGSRTRPLGSPGRTSRETWPGKFEPIPGRVGRAGRARWPSSSRCTFWPAAQAVMAQARALVGDVPNVTLHDIPTNDAWTRDHGPMFLVGPPARRRRWSIGATTPGAASIRRSIWTTRCRAHIAE